MVTTTHRIARPGVATKAMNRFRGIRTNKLFWKAAGLVTMLQCCQLMFWTTDDGKLSVHCLNGRYPHQKLNPGDSYSNGVCRVTLDRIDHKGHAIVTVSTIGKAKRS